MAGVNKVILLGNLGRDPEVSYTPGGMAVCKFSIATSRKVKGEDVTSWHRCTAFDKRGETIGRYVSKGQQLYVEGELQYGQYEKDGITRYTTDVIVNQFSFVGSKQDNGQNQSGYQQNNGNQGNQNQHNQHNQQNQGNQNHGGGFQQPNQDPNQTGAYNGNSGGGFNGSPDDDIPFACNIA